MMPGDCASSAPAEIVEDMMRAEPPGTNAIQEGGE